ncbi:hypothetical protein MN608_09423 [Microdochium nivale]|nr:hypothetical protein MN608_09423 [Microdochium nivale]
MDTVQTIGSDTSDTSDTVMIEPLITTHILDPRGDLWIRAYGEGSWGSRAAATFKVCSRTLARSSSVFDRLLYGGFSECKPPKQEDNPEAWVVDLPEDAAPAMKQLFQIMHCQFKSLETPPTAGADSSDAPSDSKAKAAARSPTIVRQLYDLIVVADKYDTIGLLRLWVAGWLHALEPKADDEQELLHKAWVYYHLGYTEGYEQTGTRLAFEFPPAAGRLVLPKAESATEPTLSPFHFIDTITVLRLKMISSLLEPIRNTTTVLLEGGSTPLGLCTRSASRYQATDADRLVCESWMLGYLLRVLRRHKLWPIPADDEVQMSPLALATIVESFSSQELAASDWGSQHGNCMTSSVCTELSVYNSRYVPHEDEAAFMSCQRVVTDVQAYTQRLGAKKKTGFFGW